MQQRGDDGGGVDRGIGGVARRVRALKAVGELGDAFAYVFAFAVGEKEGEDFGGCGCRVAGVCWGCHFDTRLRGGLGLGLMERVVWERLV